MKSAKSFFSGLFFLVISHGLWAQENPIPIREILQELQQKYEVYFSYADTNLEDVSINIEISSFDSLAEALSAISAETGLVFAHLADTQYIITTKRVSDSVSLVLLDHGTGLPVVGALVYGNAFEVSNNAGTVHFKKVDADRLMIQHIGYQSMSYQASQETVFDTLYLKQNLRILPELQVFNYLSDGMYKAVDGSIVLAVDPLRMLPGMTEPDVLQNLKFLPGIQSTSESLSEINIRGGTPDQNLLLYNDVRVYQPGHFFGLISVFNPHMVQEAQLIKEGTSARYGDAASGVIALTSKENIPDQIEATAGISMLNADAQINIPIQKHGALMVSGRRSLGDWLQTPTYSSYFERAFYNTEINDHSTNASTTDQTFRFYDAQLQYVNRWKDRRSSTKLFGLTISNDLTFLETDVINGTNQNRESNLKQQSLIGGVDILKWWNRSFNSRLLVSASKYDLEGNNADVARNQDLHQVNQVLDYQIKLENRWRLSDQSDVLLGYQGNNIGVLNINELNNPSIREEIKRVMTTHVLFGEWYRTLAGFDFQLGLRNVFFLEPKKVSLEPRIRIFKPFSDVLGAELTAEVRSQSLYHKVDLQTDFLGVEKRKWFLATRDLFTPVSSKQATLGLLYQKDGLLADAKMYVKQVREISTVSQDFVNQFSQLVENGSYHVKGLDFLLNYRWSNWNTWTSYSYMDNLFDFPNLVPPSFLNNTSVPHNVSSGVSYRNAHWDVSSGINWHLGRPYTTVTADSVINNTIAFDVPNGNRLPAFFRWDVSGQYRWKLANQWQGVLGLSIWNLTNRLNVISRYFRLQEDFSLNRVDQPALPFTLNAVLRIRFN